MTNAQVTQSSIEVDWEPAADAQVSQTLIEVDVLVSELGLGVPTGVEKATFTHTLAGRNGGALNPLVADFRALEQANGGQIGMTGRVSPDELSQDIDASQDGSIWQVGTKENGATQMWGKCKTPALTGGVVDLSAEGPARLADKELERLLGQSYEGFVYADEHPHNYTQNKHIEVDIRRGRIAFRGEADHTFAGGEIAGAVFFALRQRLRRIAFTINRPDVSTAWELVLHGADIDDDGLGASLTEIETWPLDTGDPTDIDYDIADHYDLLRLSLRKVGAGTPSDPPRFWVTGLRVNGPIGDDDDVTASDVVRFICARLGVSDALVRESGIPVFPFDLRDLSYADALDLMSIFTGWRWLFHTRNLDIVCDFAPYSRRRWVLVDPETPLDLLPEPRYSRVVVNHRWADGVAIGQVEAIADPNTLGRIVTAPVINLDVGSGEELAESIAQRLANFYVKQRWTGSLTFTRVRDEDGLMWHHSYVRAGDQIFVPQVNTWVDIDVLERTQPHSTVNLPSGLPLLDRFNARRARKRSIPGR